MSVAAAVVESSEIAYAAAAGGTKEGPRGRMTQPRDTT
jgi:hypothetical protein